MLFEQRPAMWTVLEFRQLIGGQRGIEVMHHLGIGVAARAKLDHPCAIFLAIFLRPFLDKIVAKIGRGIAAVTTGAREAPPKMNVVDDFLDVHVHR